VAGAASTLWIRRSRFSSKRISDLNSSRTRVHELLATIFSNIPPLCLENYYDRKHKPFIVATAGQNVWNLATKFLLV